MMMPAATGILNMTTDSLFLSVTKRAFDPSGKNLYHKLCKEKGTNVHNFDVVKVSTCD